MTKCPLTKGCCLREVSISGGLTVLNVLHRSTSLMLHAMSRKNNSAVDTRCTDYLKLRAILRVMLHLHVMLHVMLHRLTGNYTDW